jgi:hypothetical protein
MKVFFLTFFVVAVASAFSPGLKPIRSHRLNAADVETADVETDFDGKRYAHCLFGFSRRHYLHA